MHIIIVSNVCSLHSLSTENRKKKELIETLISRGYESDPVKAWKAAQTKSTDEGVDTAGDDESVASAGSGSGPDFAYLHNMPLLNLTKEKKDELLKQRDEKVSSSQLYFFSL